MVFFQSMIKKLKELKQKKWSYNIIKNTAK